MLHKRKFISWREGPYQVLWAPLIWRTDVHDHMRLQAGDKVHMVFGLAPPEESSKTD